jgi:hypothetical protein
MVMARRQRDFKRTRANSSTLGVRLDRRPSMCRGRKRWREGRRSGVAQRRALRTRAPCSPLISPRQEADERPGSAHPVHTVSRNASAGACTGRAHAVAQAVAVPIVSAPGPIGRLRWLRPMSALAATPSAARPCSRGPQRPPDLKRSGTTGVLRLGCRPLSSRWAGILTIWSGCCRRADQRQWPSYFGVVPQAAIQERNGRRVRNLEDPDRRTRKRPLSRRRRTIHCRRV